VDSARDYFVSLQDSVYVKFVSEAAAGEGFKALHGWIYDGMFTCVLRFKLPISS